MNRKLQLEENKNWIVALAMVAAVALLTGLRFDYYYDLNDDVLMKDILAGVYTGTPEGHNIQMLWLISQVISLFYKMAGKLPWYGIFLTLCHYGCLFLIINRSLTFCRTLVGKLAVALSEGWLLSILLLEHFVFAQYTVTCTFLAATAAFLFFTTPEGLPAKAFVKKNISAVLLVFLAFLVRSEMLLLVLPLICAAGVIRWGSEKEIFTKEHNIQYLSIFGLILLGLLIGQGSHMLAYSSPQWRAFTMFFDNRTELYDYQVPPAYEGNEAFFDSIGLEKSERILLDNYNFGMDEEIDEKMIGEIAVYAGQLKKEAKPFGVKLKEKLSQYVYRLAAGHGKGGSDYPWNTVIVISYLSVFVLSLVQKKWGILWKLALLAGVRTGLWMFILMGDRAPERITHSLYLMELCILGAMLLIEGRRLSTEKSQLLIGGSQLFPTICLSLFVILSLILTPERLKSIADRQIQREEVNAPYQELYSYLTSGYRTENFYLIDVYSSVAYSEKMFANVDNSLDNYDIMGGWACKSPLQRKKLAAFGIDNMEQALREAPNVYFVRSKQEDMSWLPAYYEAHGTPVNIRLTDTVADCFEIYAVEPAKE